jgi:hypothetical protein
MIEGNSVKKGTGNCGAFDGLGLLVGGGKGTVFFGSASGEMRIGEGICLHSTLEAVPSSGRGRRCVAVFMPLALGGPRYQSPARIGPPFINNKREKKMMI